MARNMGGLQEVRAAPGWQPAKKEGLQFCNHVELNPANNLRELEGSFILQSLQVRTQPSQHLDFSPVTLNREPSHTRLDFRPIQL